MKKVVSLLVLMVLVLGAGTTAQALTSQYFGEDQGLGDHNGRLLVHPNADAARDSFLAQLVGVGTEDFESFSHGDTSPLALVFPGAGTATLTGSGEVNNTFTTPVFDGSNPEPDGEWYGRFAISGVNYFNQVLAPGFQIDFSDPVAAFGFYSTDIGDFAGTLTLTFVDGVNTVINFPNTFTNGGSVAYFGYINTDNPFTSVVFSTSSGGDAFGFDDLTIGSIGQVRPEIPAPGSLLLGCIGLVSVARTRLARKKA